MKKLCIAIFFLIIFILVFFLYLKNKSTLLSPTIEKSPVIEKQNLEALGSKEIDKVALNEYEYAYTYFFVKNPKNLKLIPNFIEKKSTQEIREKEACLAGINGGFYDKEDNPLGGFVSEGKTYKESIKSSLLDGFLSLSENQAFITIGQQPNVNISLQSGPLLIYDGNPISFKIQQDKFARRSLAFITEKNELVFMTIFDLEYLISGPKLEELPLILNAIDNQQGFFIQSAINLDGGNASAIHTEKISIP